MAFRFDEDQLALADGVEDLLLGRAKGEYARAVADGEADWGELWAAVSELGIPAMAVPEELGGLGLGPIELVAVCERVGRHLALAPIVATAGAFVPTANAAGGEPRAALERVVAGAAATLAYVDPSDRATIELRDGALFAADVLVPDADRVELIEARYDGRWELPVLGEVTAPGAVLIRPDGYVAWTGAAGEPALPDALTTWFGAASKQSCCVSA